MGMGVVAPRLKYRVNTGRVVAGIQIQPESVALHGLPDLGAARQRVEDGLPPYGKLWEEASEEERRRYKEEARKRVASYND